MLTSLKPLLTTYAYNILGTLQDAEDVVQDVFLKYHLVKKEAIENEKAYLIRMVINFSINLKKKLQKKTADYPGEWLPEPVSTDRPDESIRKKEILSYSLMVLLEKLNPQQRGVFILKEAFDYGHEEIAMVLGITTDYSRQILNRAKKKLQQEEFKTEPVKNAHNLDKYVQVITSGDVAELEAMLNEEIAVISDGGGKAVAFRNPVLGRKHVLALLYGLHHKFYADARIEKTEINHQPALLYYDKNDNEKIVTCQMLIFDGDLLTNVFFMRNPGKLKKLQKNSR